MVAPGMNPGVDPYSLCHTWFDGRLTLLELVFMSLEHILSVSSELLLLNSAKEQTHKGEQVKRCIQ